MANLGPDPHHLWRMAEYHVVRNSDAMVAGFPSRINPDRLALLPAARIDPWPPDTLARDQPSLSVSAAIPLAAL